MSEETILDMMLYGVAILFMAVVALLMNANGSNKKINERVKRVSGKNQTQAALMQKEMSLRRKKQESSLRFMQAGIMTRLAYRIELAGLGISVEKYLMICAGAMLLLMGVLAAVLGWDPLVSALMAFTLGVGLPHMFVSFKLAQHRKKFLLLFPDGIDLIVRGLRAGLPVAESMKTVSQEISAPVGPVFGDVCDQVALGVPLEHALMEMARRLQITEFNFFIISVILQSETGGNLGEILNNLSEVLRQRHVMKLKIKALSSEAKASAIIVGSLPFVVFVALQMMSPDYLIPLFDDVRGNMAGIGALASLGIGVFIMTQMTKFEI